MINWTWSNSFDNIFLWTNSKSFCWINRCYTQLSYCMALLLHWNQVSIEDKLLLSLNAYWLVNWWIDWLIDWHWEMIYFFGLWLELCCKPIKTALWNKLLIYCSLPGGTKSNILTLQLKLLVKHSQTSYNGLSLTMDSSFGGKDAITHTPLTSVIKDTSKMQLLCCLSLVSKLLVKIKFSLKNF